MFPSHSSAVHTPVASSASPAGCSYLCPTPFLSRLCSAVTVPLEALEYWTDGQLQLNHEIVVTLRSLAALPHQPPAAGEEEDDTDEDAMVGNSSTRLLQQLVDDAADSGNMRHMLLVLCYHLRHLVEQQRKWEARQSFRQKQSSRQQRHSTSAAAGQLLVPTHARSTLPLPAPSSSSLSSSPPVCPAEGHWLLCLMSSVRLLLQSLLERLPCQHRELFFRHLRRRRDIVVEQPDSAMLAPAASPRSDYCETITQSPPTLPLPSPSLSRSMSCNDLPAPVPSVSSTEHHISIPTAPSSMPHPTADRGEDLLRMLLSTLMQACIHVPVTAGSSALHSQLLALLYCLMEAHDQDDCDRHCNGSQPDSPTESGKSTETLRVSACHATFLQPLLALSEGETAGSFSKLGFRLMHALLLHYTARARSEQDKAKKEAETRAAATAPAQPAEEEKGALLYSPSRKSSLLRRFTASFSSLLTSSIHRSLRFFFPPATDDPLADQSALLSLWLSYQFGPQASLSSNPLRLALAQMQDGSDRRGRVVPPHAGGGEEDVSVLRFELLYRSIALSSRDEWTCVFLFHLLNVNVAFRRFVIRHPQLDCLLLPLLHVLWQRVDLSCNWVYMIVNCFLVLSQEAEFNAALHERRVDEDVPWLREEKVRDISMHDLVLLVAFRCIERNLQTEHGAAAYNNALAALANMAAAPVGNRQSASTLSWPAMHPYAAYTLVSLFSSTCQRMTELLQSAIAASPSHSIRSVSQIPQAFNTCEAVGALCLDIICHLLLPGNAQGSVAVLHGLCSAAVRNVVLKLVRLLEVTRVRIFQHVSETEADEPADTASSSSSGGGSVEYDLLSDLTDFLSSLPSHHTPRSRRAWCPRYTSSSARLWLPAPPLPPARRPAAVTHHPFPFDPLVFRGHYVYEERDNSCHYFWPHFRVFAYRLGLGKGAAAYADRRSNKRQQSSGSRGQRAA